MHKTRSRYNKSDTGKDTKKARLEAAQFFVKGDRVRSQTTGKMGVFTGINQGEALPEAWVVFDSDTDSRFPVSCNPLDLELAQKDCPEHKVLRELGMLGDTQLPHSNTQHNGWEPGMRVWSERTITQKDKPEQVMRMTGKAVGVTSPGELHMEFDEQNIDNTPALVDKAAVTPEVVEELAGGSSDHMLETGTTTTTQEVRDMAATVDDTSVTAVEVVEELTEEEAADRHRLELKIERAFYEAGLALKELKERKLFRSTHSNFDVYCRDRFRFSRDKADLLIKAVGVVDNLEKSDNCRTFLPTAESQVRDLVDLTPAFQCEIYAQAVEEAGGKVPTRRIVKGIVERLKERNATPPPIPYSKGDVVEIRAGSNSTLHKHDGCWGIITHVGTFSCKVHIGVRNVNVQCKPDEIDPVDPKYTADIWAVHQRITALSELDLDPVILSMLETLCRQTCFTQIQMNLLACAEQHYGISPKESKET